MDYTAVTVIVVYLVLVTAIGSAMARRTKSAKQWAIAGGGMSTAMIAFGIAGTRIGGAGTYGVAGDVMRGGLWHMWWYGISTFLALAIVGVFFAVYFRRLRLQTVGEIFTIRFGSRRGQWFTSLCVQTEYAIVNVIEAYVIGLILSTLTPLSMFEGVLIAAATLSTYVALGGLWGTAVTNLIHCSVILVGLLGIVWMGVSQLGGWTAVTERVNAHLENAGKDPAGWWAFAGVAWLPIFGMIFATVIHTPAASVYTNYSSAAKSERALVPAFLLAGVIGATMPILAGLVGVLTSARYGFDTQLGGYRNLTKLAADISPVLGGIALAAVLAAVISSGGPILLASATMFVRDWLPFARNHPRQRAIYRVTTVLYAFAAAFVAWVIAGQVSLLALLMFGFAMVVPPAIALAYVVYWRRTTEHGAFWGMVSGYAAGLICFVVVKTSETGEGIDPSYATTFVPLVVVPVVSLWTANRGREDFFELLSGDKRIEAG